MKKRHGIITTITVLAIILLLDVVIIFAWHRNKNSANSEDLKPLVIEELTEEQQKNILYLFGDEQDRLENAKYGQYKSFINSPESYKGYSYTETKLFSPDQIKYGPVMLGMNKDREVEVKKRNDLVEIAKTKVSIDYTGIETAKDPPAEKWRMRFYNDTEEQCVYMYYDGKINMITEILKIDESPLHQG